MGDIVRVRSIHPRTAESPAICPVLRAASGGLRPTAAMFEAHLADPRMKIGIEVEAILASA